MPRNVATRRLYPALFAVVVLTLILAACGSSDDPPGTTGSGGSGTEPGGPMEYPRGETDLVLRVEQQGGFLPVELVFTTVPGFSLYGDGRVIYSGPIPEIFPGPALPNLVQVQLTEDGVRQLLEAARQAGLTQDQPDLGDPPVADAPTTVFTLAVNGRTHVVRAYALGYEPDLSGEATPPGEASGGVSPGSSGEAGGGVEGSDPGSVGVPETELVPDTQGQPVFQLSAEQREARRRLLEFQSRLMDLKGLLSDEVGAEEPYPYVTLDVISQEANSAAPDPSGVEPSIQDWPLENLAALGEVETRGRRFQVTGEDLETLAPQLAAANTLTLWRSGEGLYTLYFRPLLPDESAGPGAPTG